ncbi:FG-GAP repeat domain-containing protein [Streptomyces sp. NPDC007088]|uniref:FG-GAP repeat domain-containing protein n=1 Tax=Streptomyces sp. NPDC007088 TaxID=3364773 RepID=UPI0036BC5B2E
MKGTGPVRGRGRRLAGVLLCCGLLLTGCGGGGGRDGDGGEGDGRGGGPARPAPGAAHHPPDPADLNGDGRADAVLSDGHTAVVLWGADDGLDPRRTTRVEATAQPLRADVDGDGFTDLVATTGLAGKERTLLLRGGPRGLGRPQRLRTPPGFVPGAAGDFDGDGAVDLFDGGRGGRGDKGAAPGRAGGRLLRGPFSGLAPASAHRLDLGQHGYSSPSSVAAGDFDGDGRTDLVLGYAYDAQEDESAPGDLTPVRYERGGPDGPRRDRAAEARLIRAAGSAEGGFAASAGDVDGDRAADLLVPGAGPDGRGRLTVLRGGPGGPGTGRPATRVLEGRQRYFGATALAGRIDGDERPDLVLGTPDARRHDGLVTVTTAGGGRQRLTALDDWMPGRPNKAHWNEFQPLALLDTDGDHHDDLLALAPRHDGGKGVYVLLRGTEDGLSTGHVRHFAPREIGLR